MTEFPIDIVIPYVNGDDPFWQEMFNKYRHHYSTYCNGPERYKDWCTLKHLLRSIETYVPWVNKVFLIVCSESQIPSWLNVDNPKLEIVLHKDYIPEQFLPTFNSTVIESFLYRIKNLSEHFIYGNDDFFFNKPLYPEDFFKDGKLVMNLTKFKTNKLHMYQNMWDNCCRIGMRESGLYDPEYHYRTDHGYTPMRKSVWEHLFIMYEDELYEAMTPFRTSKNVTQHLSHVYELSIGNLLPSRIKNKHIRIINISNLVEDVSDLDTFAIEDIPVKNFDELQQELLVNMELLYPNPSSFEK